MAITIKFVCKDCGAIYEKKVNLAKWKQPTLFSCPVCGYINKIYTRYRDNDSQKIDQ